MNESRTGPGIRIPPPVIYLAAVLVGLAMNQVHPLSVLPEAYRYVAGLGVMLGSFLIISFVVKCFRRAGTPFFNLRKPASTLVTDGPYRYSRNPGYVALSIVYVGVGLLLNNLWVLVLLVPVLVAMHYGVVLREERHLEKVFGEQYRQYKSRVRRWL